MALGDGQMRATAPAIAPNGSVLFVVGPGRSARDGGDLYVSLPRGDTWTQPVRLAPPLNSPFGETAASVSADGRTLYFASERLTPGAAAWPRPRRVTTLAEVTAELRAVTLNGLRNIYSVDISGLGSSP